jgi:hypothetical protein
MKRFVLFAALSLALIASGALAGVTTDKVMVRGNYGTLHGQAIGSAKAEGDTTYVLGGPGTIEGKFEDAFGAPQWNGWTSEDLTFSADSFWQVTDNPDIVVNGTYSMWCGTLFDGDPGYGNGWNQNLVFTHQVADNTDASSIAWTMAVQNDTEPGYDYTYVEWNQGGTWQQLAQYDDNRDFAFNESFTYAVEDYVGSDNDEIQLRVRFASDGAWSDEDGLWETQGAVQIDDIVVTLNGTEIENEDFEDGQSQNWVPVLDPGVGDYAQLYTNLQDGDPCRTNFSPQVAFIDDGIVVPGTGGTQCITWCYGPGGFIVNNTGGPMGPDFYIHNIIKSPVKPFPTNADAAYLVFEVYRHEELGAPTTWPGMFYEWFVRSTDSGDPADIEAAAWQNRNFVQYGGPDYLRQQEVVTDLLTPGRTHVQVGLTVYELGYQFGWTGTDGTPAPYFDNVAFVAYPFAGPGISSRSIDLANDGFPALGDIDYGNLANNSIRFDMANNIAPDADLVNDPGDSITADITAVRSGTDLVEFPELRFRMKANDIFSGVRDLSGVTVTDQQTGFFPDGDDLIEGYVFGDSTFNANGGWVENRFDFDLPDTGFFFPGDVIHYFIRAEDTGGGVTTLPGDTTGFAKFDHDLSYPSDFIVRGLPTLFSASSGDQPTVLFWNDFAARGGENEWMFALKQLGFQEGVDYDLYYTNGPSSGVGNGLGGRATSAQLFGYDTMLYTAGDLSTNLLSNGDFGNDPSEDIQVVTNWLNQGDKNIFMTGDDLVTGLLDAGTQGSAFVNQFIPVNRNNNSILSLIDNQTAPIVSAIGGNPVFARVDEWIAYGGCLGINTFDALTTTGTSQRLAEFTNPNGQGGAYPYAAAVYNNESTTNSDVVLMAHDFMFLYNAPGWTPPAGYEGFAARAVLLEDVLDFFGESGGSAPVGVTPDAPLTVSNYPNPFNPQTTIKLNLPKAGDVSLKVFNVRGALVRTLVDGQMAAGEHSIIWDGKTEDGNQAPSGVYFYETRANGEVKVNKMALVK